MKNKIIWTNVLLILTLCTVTQAHCKTRTDYMNIPGTIVYVAPDVTYTDLSAEIDIYNQLDPGVRQALANLGIRYYIINEKNDNTAYGHTGDTMFEGDGDGIWTATTSLNTIYSEGRLQKDLKYGGTVMNHELGHVVDVLYGGGQIFDRCISGQNEFGASNTEEWTQLYKKYKTTIAGFGGLSKYEVYNAAEAFAESYGHYAKDPAKVRKAAPEIAAYIDIVNADVIYRFAPEYYQN